MIRKKERKRERKNMLNIKKNVGICVFNNGIYRIGFIIPPVIQSKLPKYGTLIRSFYG